MHLPYELIKYIFLFLQDNWFLINNKLIDITKLHKIQKPNPPYVDYSKFSCYCYCYYIRLIFSVDKIYLLSYSPFVNPG